ncbi:MAG: hypothetical protein J2P13_10790, partial [Acidobacteria bacterium]|nr:hypothetical protein [Acidobacteriota bacterium]
MSYPDKLGGITHAARAVIVPVQERPGSGWCEMASSAGQSTLLFGLRSIRAFQNSEKRAGAGERSLRLSLS